MSAPVYDNGEGVFAAIANIVYQRGERDPHMSTRWRYRSVELTRMSQSPAGPFDCIGDAGLVVYFRKDAKPGTIGQNMRMDYRMGDQARLQAVLAKVRA